MDQRPCLVIQYLNAVVGGYTAPYSYARIPRRSSEFPSPPANCRSMNPLGLHNVESLFCGGELYL